MNAGDLTHGFRHFTSDMLRKRIKSIKTVYGTDLMKDIKSKKRAASPNENSQTFTLLVYDYERLRLFERLYCKKKITCSLVRVN